MSLSSTQKIIRIGLRNLDLHKKASLTPTEVESLRKELDESVIPPVALEGFFEGGDALEEMPDHNEHSVIKRMLGFAAPKETEEESKTKNSILARNLLRHLLRGALYSKQDQSIIESPLFRYELLEALTFERKKEVFDACRVELQKVLLNCFNKVNVSSLDAKLDKRYQIFLNMALGIYPFIDPEDKEDVKVPQKINGKWDLVDYKFKRLDVSPKTGLLSYLLEDQDRMYAYALERQPSAPPGANNILILMGTTYPAGQGSGLADLYNVYPRHSVGEAHDMTDVDAWVQQQANDSVKITGHSKGATDAYITAIRHSRKIQQADCLCPAPLTQATLDRLAPVWNAIDPAKRANYTVYKQKGDMVAFIGKGYFPGTTIYQVVADTNNSALSTPLLKTYFSHVGHLAGQEKTAFTKVDAERLNRSKLREFVDDVKSVLDWLLFSFGYAKLCMQLILRKIGRFCGEHKAAIRVCLIAAGLLVGIGLLVAGIFAPPVLVLAKLILVKIGIALTPVVVQAVATAIAMVTLIVGSVLVPFVLEMAAKITIGVTSFALQAAHFATVFVVGLFAAAISGIKIAFKSFFTNAYMSPQEVKEKEKLTLAKSTPKKVDEKTPLLDKGNALKAVEMESIDNVKVADLPEKLSSLPVLSLFLPVKASARSSAVESGASLLANSDSDSEVLKI